MSEKYKNIFSESTLELVPHIIDYAVVQEKIWLPYLMGSTLPQIRSDRLNTDAFGFRYTIDIEGNRMSPENMGGQPVNLVLGASQPFGFGATSDATTFASYLSRSSRSCWCNLAMPGMTLPQNIIQLMFFLPKLGRVKKIVLLGGVTDLNHFFRTPLYPKVVGSFFQFMEYFSKLNGRYIDQEKGEIRLPAEFGELYSENTNPSESYEFFLDSLKNSLHVLSFFAKSLDAELVFALQPVVKWMNRTPSAEEQRLIYDKPEHDNAHDERTTQAYQQWYGSALQGICGELGIEYLDLNHFFAASKKSDQWLLIDNVHFHDNGSDLAAEIIIAEASFM